MKIVVLSDTHIPESAKDLPEAVYADLKDAQLILHAGDLTSVEFLKKLEKIAEVKAVCGNMDEPDLQKMLPAKQIVRAGKFSIGLMHGCGHPDDLVNLAVKEFAKDKPNIVIFGHSHKPLNMHKCGMLIFNPGSPTDKIFANINTYGIITIDNTVNVRLVKIYG